MIQRALEVSRERVGPHSWRVTLSDGTTQEEIDLRGCVLTPPPRTTLNGPERLKKWS
jgi:hypothetical protein